MACVERRLYPYITNQTLRAATHARRTLPTEKGKETWRWHTMIPRSTSESFETRQQDDIVLIRLRRDLLEITTDLEAKEELFAALQEVEQAADVRALILLGDAAALNEAAYVQFLDALFGAEAPVGSTQSDLAKEQLLSREEYGITQFIVRIHAFRKITVAALQGALAPPYLGIALAFDCRLVTHDTVFDLAFSRFNVPPSGALGFFLPLYVGQGRAMDLVLCGSSLGAARAHALGLVNAVLPADGFADRCRVRVEEMLDVPLDIAGATKSLMVPYTEEELARYLERECDVVRSTWRQRTLRVRRSKTSS